MSENLGAIPKIPKSPLIKEVTKGEDNNPWKSFDEPNTVKVQNQKHFTETQFNNSVLDRLEQEDVEDHNSSILHENELYLEVNDEHSMNMLSFGVCTFQVLSPCH